jgi:hypothetical protein
MQLGLDEHAISILEEGLSEPDRPQQKATLGRRPVYVANKDSLSTPHIAHLRTLDWRRIEA